MSFIKRISLLMGLCLVGVSFAKHDVTVVGFIDLADGLGQEAYGMIDCLRDHVSVNYISTNNRYDDVSARSEDMDDIIRGRDKTPGNVALLTDTLRNYKAVPQTSKIKIAYSMFESTRIPVEWVSILNEKFDAVAVPDPWLVGVYEESGVRIPIFHVPLGIIHLNELLEMEPKERPSRPFTFGNMSALFVHKNPLLLIEAFHGAFGNSPDVQLMINARGGDQDIADSVTQRIRELGATNILFTIRSLSQAEYFDFMNSLDCYVNLSRGEGFSKSPREAMALGVPVIAADSTAQKTICQSGLVRAVPCTIKVPAYYPVYQQNCGHFFGCSLDEATSALLDMYDRYDKYLAKAHKARKWVKQYQYSELEAKYRNLVKPTEIFLGSENKVTDNFLMTNSPELYRKYKKIMQNQSPIAPEIASVDEDLEEDFVIEEEDDDDDGEIRQKRAQKKKVDHLKARIAKNKRKELARLKEEIIKVKTKIKAKRRRWFC